MVDEDFLVRLRRNRGGRVDPEFVLDARDQRAMGETRGEVPSIHVPVRTMANCHFVADGAAERDLDALHRIEHKQAQLAIEVVEVEQRLKGGAGMKRLLRPRGVLKYERVGRKPAVPDPPQLVQGRRGVRDDETPGLQLRELIVRRHGRFGELHERPLKTKHPPWCACPTPDGAG
jgi:hypothetical protein